MTKKSIPSLNWCMNQGSRFYFHLIIWMIDILGLIPFLVDSLWMAHFARHDDAINKYEHNWLILDSRSQFDWFEARRSREPGMGWSIVELAFLCLKFQGSREWIINHHCKKWLIKLSCFISSSKCEIIDFSLRSSFHFYAFCQLSVWETRLNSCLACH